MEKSQQGSSKRGSRRSSRPQSKNFKSRRKPPETSRQALKIIPLGGLEEFGKNMWALEQENDIILLDMGLQMPGPDQPGVDYIIPNTQYLADNADRIRGVFFTSAHYDHIGAVPYILSMFPNLHLYATEATFAILESRHDFYSQDIQYKKHVLKDYVSMRVGSFKVTPFSVGFNVPGAVGLCIYTMQGKVFYISSYKLNIGEGDSKPEWLESIKELASGDTFALIGDSLGAEAEGFAPTENVIGQKIREICDNPRGKVYISTFPSMLHRLQQIVDASEALGRHVFIEGKAILNTFNTARKKGYIKVKAGTIVSPSLLSEIPDNKLVIIMAGAQGDDIPHLMRMANREQGNFEIKEGDVVAFPSELIPGNERSVQKINDNFAKLGATTHHYRPLGVHHSSHARVEDIKAMLVAVRPKYYIPANGPHYLLRINADIALSWGYNDKNVVVGQNGRVILFDYKHRKGTPEIVPAHDVLVDGLGVGDLKDVVIRDRKLMSEDGIVNLIVILDSSSRRLLQTPEIVSKGFVDTDKSDRLLAEVRHNVSLIVEAILADASEINTTYIRDELREQIGKFLFAKTERRPMLLPVIVIV